MVDDVAPAVVVWVTMGVVFTRNGGVAAENEDGCRRKCCSSLAAAAAAVVVVVLTAAEDEEREGIPEMLGDVVVVEITLEFCAGDCEEEEDCWEDCEAAAARLAR